MKAISLWQPWATACMDPYLKVHETRHWPAPRRMTGERVAIHAAKKQVPPWDLDEEVESAMNHHFGPPWRHRLPFGAIIGTAVLAECFKIERSTVGSGGPVHPYDRLFGNWEPGRYAWRLVDRQTLATPIPWKGAQGFFNIPDEVLL